MNNKLLIRIKREKKRNFNSLNSKRIRKHIKLHGSNKAYKIDRKLNNKLVKKNNRVMVSVPENYNIFDNLSETIQFHKRIKSLIEKGNPIHIGMADMQSVDPSSIMYLLSIFKNFKHQNIHYSMNGTTPKNIEISRKLYNIGFYNFVDINLPSIIKENNSDAIMITENSIVDSDKAKGICNFIMTKLSLSRKDIHPYYEMLIELMDNTVHHAYQDKDHTHNWYIFVEYEDNKIKLLFFDNGLGITKTISRTHKQKFDKLFGILAGNYNNYDLIDAAFNGQFMTATKEKHRGKGLPMIKDLIDNSVIMNVKILTNNVFYSIIKKEDIKDSIDGTMYYWEIWGKR